MNYKIDIYIESIKFISFPYARYKKWIRINYMCRKFQLSKIVNYTILRFVLYNNLFFDNY